MLNPYKSATGRHDVIIVPELVGYLPVQLQLMLSTLDTRAIEVIAAITVV